MTKSKVVTLHLMTLRSFQLPAEITYRQLDYEQAKSLLVPLNDDAPIGLRRIPKKNLPKVGGLFGLSVVAESQVEAAETLLRLVLKAQEKADREAAILKDGATQLTAQLSRLR
jgi:hypothetical protein